MHISNSRARSVLFMCVPGFQQQQQSAVRIGGRQTFSPVHTPWPGRAAFKNLGRPRRPGGRIWHIFTRGPLVAPVLTRTCSNWKLNPFVHPFLSFPFLPQNIGIQFLWPAGRAGWQRREAGEPRATANPCRPLRAPLRAPPRAPPAGLGRITWNNFLTHKKLLEHSR